MAKTRNNMQKKSQVLDLSYARAARLMPPAWDRLPLVLVGCGGAGSWLAPSVAAIATDYLLRMLNGWLKRFGTWFDLSAGSMRSCYITAEEVAKVIKKPTGYVVARAGA